MKKQILKILAKTSTIIATFLLKKIGKKIKQNTPLTNTKNTYWQTKLLWPILSVIAVNIIQIIIKRSYQKYLNLKN